MSALLIAAVPVAILLTTILAVAVAKFIRVRARTRSRKPAREPSAFILLDGNLWDACTVDDVREPWSRYTTEPVRGFCGVPAGRHRIRTTVPTSSGAHAGRASEAVLDFVVYPGEVLSWRLDAERARWEPHDVDEATRTALQSVPVSTTDLVAAATRPKLPGWLVHLRTTMNLVGARPKAPPAKAADDATERVKKRLAKLIVRTNEDDGSEATEILASARGLGEALVGKPLTRREIRLLVAPVREAASRLLAHGDHDRAMRVLGLGLALLPSDPELMVLAGCTLAARGESDDALGALNAALERDRCLDAADVARAMRTRLELRSRHGRSVRV